MVDFWDPHKMATKKRAFSALLKCMKWKWKQKIKKKLWKKERRIEKRPNVHLILSHVNHTFLILNPPIGPQAFRHTRCTLRFFIFFWNVKKGPIQHSICFKLVLGLLVLGSLSKVALKVLLPLFVCVCVCARVIDCVYFWAFCFCMSLWLCSTWEGEGRREQLLYKRRSKTQELGCWSREEFPSPSSWLWHLHHSTMLFYNLHQNLHSIPALPPPPPSTPPPGFELPPTHMSIFLS